MGLPWVRLQTDLPKNPKILQVLSMPSGSRTAFAYVCALAYAGETTSDGFIPKAALPFIHATNPDAKRLVNAGLWIEDKPKGGWWINDWGDYQPTVEYVKKRSAAGKKAARARWDKQPEVPTETITHETDLSGWDTTNWAYET